jgi:hypothetical protein
MSNRRVGLSVLAIAGSLLASIVVVVPVVASSSAGNGTVRHLTPSGATSFNPSQSSSSDGIQSNELGPGSGDAAGGGTSSHNNNGVNRSRSIQHTAASVSGAPVTPGVGVSSGGPLPVVASFDGMNHYQQRHANHGNQFSLEPPDQGLCAGNGFVVEIINDVIRVYSPSGAPMTGVQDLNTFLGYAAAFDRSGTNPNPFGPFVTDPSCYYDPIAQRWFADALTLDVFSDSGAFTGSNHLDIAVSTSNDPTKTWTIYHTQVQDDGNNGTPNHGCTGIAPYGQSVTPTYPNACLGDYPHLGADANAIFLTTNEYSFFGNDFHGAQVYAFSKADLTAGGTVSMVQFDTHGMVGGNSGFTLWPATATNGNFSSDNGGTEYFLSSNAADEAHGNGAAMGPRRSSQILEWSVTGTSNIDSSPSSVALSDPTIIPVGLYVVPPRSEQRVGPTPLADCLNKNSCATNVLLGVPDPFAPEHEYTVDSNDTRMQQVTYADGYLWAAIDTAVNSSANMAAGIEWFVVNPTAENGPSLVNSGYLAVSQNNITYPAVAVNEHGQGVIAFTLLGRGYYPSAAFASMNVNGPGAVQLAAMGAGPADGFSGTAVYNAPNPARPRWGDYGAAIVDGSNIWIASEYIGQTCDLTTYLNTGLSCGHTRTALANWDTRITEVTPAG